MDGAGLGLSLVKWAVDQHQGTIHVDSVPEKGTQVTAFYAGAISDEAARQLFAKNDVRFVIYGPYERASYPSFSPPSWLRLTRRFGAVDVYEVDGKTERKSD